MRNSENTPRGNTKKFLYTGGKQKEEQTEDQWIFSPRKPDLSPRGGAQFDLDDVWSIKKNVSLGPGGKPDRTDGLNLNANKTYYSRYGGGTKGGRGDEFDSSFGNSNFRTGFNTSETGNKSWNYSNKGFSYSSFNNMNNANHGKTSQSTSPYSNKSSGQPYTNHRNNDHDSSLW